MSESVITTKIPVFSGSTDDWVFYKPKLKALLAKKKLAKILIYKGEIREDEYEWPSDCDKALKELEEAMQEVNVEAYSILLQSIDTEKAEGKVAFNLVVIHMDDDFAGGHFPNAWKSLCDRYDELEVVDPTDLQQKYFALMMEEAEHPGDFVIKLEGMRKKLKDSGITYSDKEFINQILAKLPKGKNGELGPYQVVKRSIAKEVKGTAGYGLRDVIVDLEKVYHDVHEHKDETFNDDNEKAYVGYSKQCKGRCTKCGKHGHKSYNCRGSNYQPNNGFQGKYHFCDEVGHKMWNCRAFKEHKEQKQQESNDDHAGMSRDEIAF